MEALTGIGFAAVVAVWGLFLVPGRLKYRQQLIDAKTEDRFSSELRVVAVASTRASAPSGAQNLAAAPSAKQKGQDMQRPTTSPVSRVHAEPSPAVGATPLVAGRTASGEEGARPPKAVRERRAAAARRRAKLAGILLLALLVATGFAVAGTLHWWPALVAGAGLTSVAGLGRRAVVAQNRADAARGWAPTKTRTLNPAPAPRVAQESATTAEPSRLTPRFTMGNDTGEVAVVSGELALGTGNIQPAQDSSSTGDFDLGTADEQQAEPTWNPTPLPRPVYTFKAAAPRREPRPLEAFDPALLAAGEGRSASGLGKADPGQGELETEVPAPANPDTLSGGLSLNEVLARRRAN